MFENHLELPFETQVLGIAVTVTRIDLADDNQQWDFNSAEMKMRATFLLSIG